MTASVRILSTSSVDSSPAILLVAPDGSKILVNCGEGCQRSFLEQSQRLSSVKAVCLTHLGHEAVGGLPGAILTTADGAAAADADILLLQQQQRQQKQAGSGTSSTTKQPQHEEKMPANGGTNNSELPDLEIVGPQGTRRFLHSLRHFMRRDRFKVHAHEGAVEDLWPSKQAGRRKGKKKNIADAAAEFSFRIQSLVFFETVLDTKFNNDHYQQTSGSRKRPHDKDPGDRKRQLLSFILKTPPIPGKFQPEKAAELRIPKGPLYAQLKSGKAVVFMDDSGTEHRVESSQVVTPSSPSVAVMILYYPNNEVARQVFASKEIRAEVESSDVCLELVVHIAPRSLVDEHGLPFWKERDPNGLVEHILLSTDPIAGDIDGSPFVSAAFGATARSILCKEIYQTPRPASAPVSTQQQTVNTTGYRVGRVKMEYILIPRSKRGYLDPVTVCDRDWEDATRLVEDCGALSLSKELLSDSVQNQTTNTVSREGELIFTGTGSAMPCKHRNVTGMLLKQADGRSILLDVGEGTIGQLLRMQRQEDGSDILSSIKAVWLSHPHADHHLGLIRLLKERRSSDTIQLLAPTPLFRFLEEYAELDPNIRDTYYAIDCKYLVQDNHELRQRLQHTIGIANCRAVPVTHCKHAYAVILDGTSFGRLVYSGDCRPSTALAQEAKGADLLIHEATFEDGMEAEAALKKHSTVGEALRVALQMEARCIVLTHFSQRYPKIPPTPAGDAYQSPIVFAFDYMLLRNRTLLAASKLTPSLRLLYPEKETDDDDACDSDGDTCKEEASTAANAMSIPGVFASSSLL